METILDSSIFPEVLSSFQAGPVVDSWNCEGMYDTVDLSSTVWPLSFSATNDFLSCVSTQSPHFAYPGLDGEAVSGSEDGDHTYASTGTGSSSPEESHAASRRRRRRNLARHEMNPNQLQKRRAQNREAQRNFRIRKDTKVQELEAALAIAEEGKARLEKEVAALRRRHEAMQQSYSKGVDLQQDFHQELMDGFSLPDELTAEMDRNWIVQIGQESH